MIPASLATFLAKPIVKYGGIAVVVVLAYFAFQWWLGDVKKDARQEGVTQERTEGLQEIVNSMEKADETRREIRDDRSRARYDECLLSARNPEACKRFLSQ
jgi:membrane protein implicated in regulation of membrane protease activity